VLVNGPAGENFMGIIDGSAKRPQPPPDHQRERPTAEIDRLQDALSFALAIPQGGDPP
jgi:hypothetical protein